jgi:tight adherence protein B
LVTFSDVPTLRVAPTTDRQAVRTAVSALRAQGETALYDATAAALTALGNDGSRTIVLLTDGADTRSHRSLATLRNILSRSKVTLDAVAFRTSDAQTAPLATMAAAAGGKVTTAGAASDLASAFQQAAKEIAGEVLVTAKVPDALAGQSANIAISATAGGTQISDASYAQLAAAPVKPVDPANFAARPVHISVPFYKTRTALLGALVAVFLAIAFLLYAALATVEHERSRRTFRKRLSVFTLSRPADEKQLTTTHLGNSAVARTAVEFAGRIVEKGDFERSLGRKLEAAGVPLTVAEWLIVHVSASIIIPLAFFALSGGNLRLSLIALGVGLAAPWVYLKVKESRRASKFLTQMPDTLQLLAGSLSAGYSLLQGLDTVVREGSQPIAAEFNRALVEARLGVPVEDALEGVADRMRSKDFSWVVMAIRIQREVGGNLAEVLTTVAATLRERERLRRQVRVLSAEGRLSAWILGALPLVLALYMLSVRPGYISLLWKDRIGILLLGLLAITMTAGIVWLSRVVKVDV